MIYDCIDSTNDALWRHNPHPEKVNICLAEMQTSGRGRLGDRWQSPRTGNLYLSLSCPFPAKILPTGLSLAIGVTLIKSLKKIGINNLSLKWPNDLLHNRRKLAGILVESRVSDKQYVVIGIGLNYKLPDTIKKTIQQPTTSLMQLCNQLPCRNRLAGLIIQNMIDTLTLFQTSGLQSFLNDWQQYDALAEQSIMLIGDTTRTVIAKGINDKGELLYQHNNQIHQLTRSDIHIRFAS